MNDRKGDGYELKTLFRTPLQHVILSSCDIVMATAAILLGQVAHKKELQHKEHLGKRCTSLEH